MNALVLGKNMEEISKSTKIQFGYLHLCRVLGDLYCSWAIAETPQLAASKARYGREDERATDAAYAYGVYKITKYHCDRNGWSVYIEEVKDSKGNVVCSRES